MLYHSSTLLELYFGEMVIQMKKNNNDRRLRDAVWNNV